MKNGVDESYPEPSVKRVWGGSLWRIGALALFFIVIALAFSVFGEWLTSEMVLLFLAILAVIGVFALFALAAGLFRYSDGTETPSLPQSVLDSSFHGIVVTDRKGVIVYANQRYGQLSALVSEGAPVGVARLFASQSEAAEAIYRLSRAAKEGRHLIEDVRLARDFDGRDFENSRAVWYRISVRALPRTDTTDKQSVIWQVEDISADRDNQEHIYLELQRAIDYLDHAPAGFFSADARGRIQYINATLADWLGFDLAEFESGDARLEQIIRGDGANLLMGGRADGEIVTEVIDVDLVHTNGTSVPVRLLHRAARRSDGELGETRTLVLDRNSTSAEEEGLRAAEIRFSRFFNDTPFAIATLDDLGRIVATNAPFISIFGVSASAQAVENVPIIELIAQDSREEFERALGRVRQNRSEIAPVDALLKSDNEKAVRLYFSASEQIDGSSESVVVYALDMTEYRRLQAQITQGAKMQAVGQLAGGVAHDFNNVLTVIIGFSDLLLLKHKPSDPSFSDIMSIKQSANRAAGLVRQLLAFSRRQTLRPQVLEVPTHVDDLTVLLNRLIGEKSSLGVSHGRNVWPVRVDLVQLEQVIINLVVNARDAMPEGGKISLRTRNVPESEAASFTYRGMPGADYVLIEVEDTGTGIPDEVMEKIFEPFFTTKELNKGTGLGLSMVYGIIKQTGGYIYADTVLGQGTVFRIFLPRHIPTDDDIKFTQSQHEVKDLTGNERILLVEDEESVRAFSARALQATGYEVYEAEGGEEALEILDELDNKIDLMVSDVEMPEMDGPALLVEVRKRLPDVKVIFVSGYAQESIRNELAEDRSVEFLAKPYTLNQINSKVKEVLSGVESEEGRA